MEYSFSTLGALLGLAAAIVLIIRKVQPAYSLILGALVGGIIGGGGLVTTVDTMITGAQGMMSSVLRIMISEDSDVDVHSDRALPSFLKAVAGPLVVIVLLALRPIAGISIDPLIALPLGGAVSILITGNARETIDITEFGLSKVIGVSVLLIGTGTIAGIIKASALQFDVINLLEALNMPALCWRLWPASSWPGRLHPPRPVLPSPPKPSHPR